MHIQTLGPQRAVERLHVRVVGGPPNHIVGGGVQYDTRNALAHLGVARANALQARTQGPDADAARKRALAAHKDFLVLLKDADPDIPILKAAKAEYAKLQQHRATIVAL